MCDACSAGRAMLPRAPPDVSPVSLQMSFPRASSAQRTPTPAQVPYLLVPPRAHTPGCPHSRHNPTRNSIAYVFANCYTTRARGVNFSGRAPDPPHAVRDALLPASTPRRRPRPLGRPAHRTRLRAPQPRCISSATSGSSGSTGPRPSASRIARWITSGSPFQQHPWYSPSLTTPFTPHVFPSSRAI